MNKILNIYKPLGLTTVQALNVFKEKNPEYQNLPIAYTGRLDPMAEGVLVFLAGEKRFEAKKFQKLNKEYTAKILFGFSTDSHDLLGLTKGKSVKKISEEEVKSTLNQYKGENKLPLPPYCSYKIDGKPMFHWAHIGELESKDIPVKKMEVFNIKFEKFYSIPKSELKEYEESTINKVEGNFRQDKIIKNWNNVLKKSSKDKFQIVKVKLKVSGGTYIRSIAENLGKKLNSKSFLFHLKRTQVNGFQEEDSIYISKL